VVPFECLFELGDPGLVGVVASPLDKGHAVLGFLNDKLLLLLYLEAHLAIEGHPCTSACVLR